MIIIFAWGICLDGISKRRKIGIILIMSLLDDPYHIALKFQFSLPYLTLLQMKCYWKRWVILIAAAVVFSSSSTAAAASLLSEKPKLFNQGQLNDLVRDLDLSKESSEILASRLGEHGILDPRTKISFYHDEDDLLIRFFTMEDEFVYCNNVQGLLSEMGLLEYNPDEWRLFIDSSKGSLKCVLLHNGNKFAYVPMGHSVIVKEHYLNVKMVLQKLRYSEHNWAICVDFKMIIFC